jgi:hypothetical protein
MAERGRSHVWVASPKLRTVTVYRSLTEIAMLTEEDMVNCGDVVPGFRMAVRDIFANVKI